MPVTRRAYIVKITSPSILLEFKSVMDKSNISSSSFEKQKRQDLL